MVKGQQNRTGVMTRPVPCLEVCQCLPVRAITGLVEGGVAPSRQQPTAGQAHTQTSSKGGKWQGYSPPGRLRQLDSGFPLKVSDHNCLPQGSHNTLPSSPEAVRTSSQPDPHHLSFHPHLTKTHPSISKQSEHYKKFRSSDALCSYRSFHTFFSDIHTDMHP